jgi:vacuolar-type H+-ATPase subunit H
VGSARDTASGAAETAQEKFEGAPLAAGLVAFGAGMIIASLFPAAEKETVAASKVVDAAKEHAQPLVEQAKATGADIAQQAGEQARQAAQEVKETAQQGAEQVRSEGQSAAESVRSEAQG